MMVLHSQKEDTLYLKKKQFNLNFDFFVLQVYILLIGIYHKAVEFSICVNLAYSQNLFL